MASAEPSESPGQGLACAAPFEVSLRALSGNSLQQPKAGSTTGNPRSSASIFLTFKINFLYLNDIYCHK
jgi:hypothetical protein